MKSIPLRRALLSLLVFAVAGGTAHAQVETERPRVLVVPLYNLTGQTQNDVVADAATDTIELTLGLLDRYEVERAEAVAGENLVDATVDELERIAAERGVDNVMFGEVSRDEEGGFRFAVAVYDRAAGEVSLRADTRAAGLFDVFDASDQLVTEAVSGFSGIRIGFGSLSVNAEGDGSYVLYVDGRALGTDASSVDRLLIGAREIEIRQQRGEREATIYSETVQITEGERTTISFAFPDVTPEEEAREEELRGRLSLLLATGSSPSESARIIDELESLYERVPAGLPGTPADIPFYRDRLTLSRDFAEVARLDFRRLAELPRQSDQREALLEVYQPWVDMYERYRDREPEQAATALYDHDYQVQRIENDADRNMTALAALITLDRATLPLAENTALIRSYNRLRGTARSSISPAVAPDYSWSRQAVRAHNAVSDYERAVERRRPFWHWIVGVLGAGAAGYVAYDFVMEPTADLEAEINRNIEVYESSTDYDEIVSLRSEIEDDEFVYSMLELAPLAAGATGGVFLSTAIIGRIVSRTRPGRVERAYNEHPTRLRWAAAGLDFAERPEMNGAEDEARLVVIGQREERFRIAGEGGGVETAPYVAEIEPGTELEIEHLNAHSGDIETYPLRAEPGTNIVLLGLEE